MIRPFIFAAALLLLLGCKEHREETMQLAKNEVPRVQEHPGKKLLQQYCYTCHSPTAAMNEMIAPPMAAVKAHYLLNDPSKEEFTEQIQDFVAAPAEEKSLMPGAINRFGLMPKQSFPPEAIEKIAEYLYDFKIEEPEWFSEHWKAGPGRGKYRQQGKFLMQEKSPQTYEKRGIEIAMAAEKHLGQQLMKQLRENSTLGALQYCNEQAIPLTREVARQEKASIKRVSNRNRNPGNAANKAEQQLIKAYGRDLTKGREPSPVLIDEGDSLRFYYPLVTNDLCLQCHGRPQDISAKVQQKILQLYPQDKAVGYSEGQVRGLWKIGIPKKNPEQTPQQDK